MKKETFTKDEILYFYRLALERTSKVPAIDMNKEIFTEDEMMAVWRLCQPPENPGLDYGRKLIIS